MREYLKRVMVVLLFLGATVIVPAQADNDNMDVSRLHSRLEQLVHDPVLGTYAQADQALAQSAIDTLAHASSRMRRHALYLADRWVDQAKATAQLEHARVQLAHLEREQNQLVLQRNHLDAVLMREKLAWQRHRYIILQQETKRLRQQRLEAKQQASQAQIEASQAQRQARRARLAAIQAQHEAIQARKLAAAQTRVARSARREAELAAAAAHALRTQMHKTVHHPSATRSKKLKKHRIKPIVKPLSKD